MHARAPLPRERTVEGHECHPCGGRECGEIGIRPEVGTCALVARYDAPVLFEFGWFGGETDTAISVKRVEHIPGRLWGEHIGTHNVPVVQQTQEPGLRDTAEGHLSRAFILKPATGDPMMRMADQGKRHPDVDISQVGRQNRNP